MRRTRVALMALVFSSAALIAACNKAAPPNPAEKASSSIAAAPAAPAPAAPASPPAAAPAPAASAAGAPSDADLAAFVSGDAIAVNVKTRRLAVFETSIGSESEHRVNEYAIGSARLEQDHATVVENNLEKVNGAISDSSAFAKTYAAKLSPALVGFAFVRGTKFSSGEKASAVPPGFPGTISVKTTNSKDVIEVLGKNGKALTEPFEHDGVTQLIAKAAFYLPGIGVIVTSRNQGDEVIAESATFFTDLFGPSAALPTARSKTADCSEICKRALECKVGPFSTVDECVEPCDTAYETGPAAEKMYACIGAASSCDAVKACEKN